MSLVSVLCCQRSLKTGRSLMQRNAAECGVSECDLEPEQWGGLDPAMKRKQIHAALFLFDYFRHDRSWQLALPKLVNELLAFWEPKSSLLLFRTARHYTVPEPLVSPLHLHTHTHSSLISLLMLSFCTLRSLLVYCVWIFQLMCLTSLFLFSSVLHVRSISAF